MVCEEEKPTCTCILYKLFFFFPVDYVCLQKITLEYIIARFRWCSDGSLLVALTCAILPRSSTSPLFSANYQALFENTCTCIHLNDKRFVSHKALFLPWCFPVVQIYYGTTKDTYSRITCGIDVFRCCNGVFSPKYTVDFLCNSRVSIKNTQCHIRHEKFIHHHSEIMEKCSSYSYQFA